MFRLALVVCFGSLLFSCGNKDEEKEGQEGFGYDAFSAAFKEVQAPYQLTDTILNNNKDTAALTASAFTMLLPDSLRTKIFGKGAIRFIPMTRIQSPDAETYFIVKAVGGNKKAAIVYVYDKDGNFGASMPFLVPDNDPATAQFTSIEKSYVISRNVVKKIGGEIEDGKDVYAYNREGKNFMLIMTDPLLQNTTIVNPIDTLGRTNRFAGDYGSGKDLLISIRDGRTESQLTAFVHIKRNKGACTGELKGDLFFTSTTTAVYRQGGDPCVLEFVFKGSSVTLKEASGCGNHRDIDCLFDGTYTKKKPAATKPAKK